MLLGYYGDNSYTSDMMQFKAESFSGGYIIQREIKKAIAGKNFFFNNEEGKPVYCDGIQPEELNYYIEIWSNFHYFGLPHAGGWAVERQWLLNFLKAFETAYKNTESFVQEIGQRKAEAQAKAKELNRQKYG